MYFFFKTYGLILFLKSTKNILSKRIEPNFIIIY